METDNSKFWPVNYRPEVQVKCKHKVTGEADSVPSCPYCEADRLRADNARVIGRMSELLAALSEYGRHKYSCAVWYGTKHCSCGLDHALGRNIK